MGLISKKTSKRKNPIKKEVTSINPPKRLVYQLVEDKPTKKKPPKKEE